MISFLPNDQLCKLGTSGGERGRGERQRQRWRGEEGKKEKKREERGREERERRGEGESDRDVWKRETKGGGERGKEGGGEGERALFSLLNGTERAELQFHPIGGLQLPLTWPAWGLLRYLRLSEWPVASLDYFSLTEKGKNLQTTCLIPHPTFEGIRREFQ